MQCICHILLFDHDANGSECLTGPTVTAHGACQRYDVDGDGDVDLEDFAAAVNELPTFWMEA